MPKQGQSKHSKETKLRLCQYTSRGERKETTPRKAIKLGRNNLPTRIVGRIVMGTDASDVLEGEEDRGRRASGKENGTQVWGGMMGIDLKM